MNTTTPSLKTLLDARYGKGPQTLDAINETIDTLMQHRSVRAFTDQPLAPNTLELLIAAAQSASTSSNLQTWSVVAVQDSARKKDCQSWPAIKPLSIAPHSFWPGLPISHGCKRWEICAKNPMAAWIILK